MASPLLVGQVHDLSRRLAAVLKLLPKDDPLLRASGEKDSASFLFEVLVLVELLVAVSGRGDISPVLRDGRVVLARSPASKRSCSYFKLRMSGSTYELLHGTKVADRHGSTQAADFTLQEETSADAADYQNVLAIWDAKLRGETGLAASERVDKSEVNDFLYMLDALNVPKPGDPRDVLAGWPDAFEVPAVISNGRVSTHPESALLEKGCAITAEFANWRSPCSPSRAVHVANRAKANLIAGGAATGVAASDAASRTSKAVAAPELAGRGPAPDAE